MLDIGQPAPDFTLQNQDSQPVSLGSLRGSWVVLYFYPKDDTPGCTIEACEFTDGLKKFQGLNAKVFGISPDSPQSHQKFIAKHKLQIDLLADTEKAMLARYGAWGEKTLYGKKSLGVIRSTVILDPNGRIAKRWAKVQAAGHAAQVEAALLELQGGAATKPAKPSAKKAAKKATKKAAKKVAKSTAKRAAKPASKQTTKPAAKPAAKQVSKKTATKKVAKKAAKKASKKAAKR